MSDSRSFPEPLEGRSVERTTGRPAAGVQTMIAGRVEERFRAFADNISQLAWMADASGWHFWYNPRWLQYTGLTFEEAQGWGWQRAHHPEHLPAVLQKLRRSFATGETWEDTFPLRGADGGYRWFLSRAVPVRSEIGEIAGWVGTNTDITRQRALEEELRDTARRKEEFLGILGHELRGPLAPILTAVHLLKRKMPADPELARLGDTIERQTLHLSKLVEDLLDVGRIAAGKLALNREPVSLGAVLAEGIETCTPLIAARRHSLDVVWPERPIHLHADAGRLVQVVCNLLSNAAKYTQEGGAIRVSALEEGGCAAIRVKDNGVGVAPEMSGHIFDRFSQIGMSAHGAQGGLGVGLWVVKTIVELHGGTVRVESRGPGTGSEFVVTLPLPA